MMTSYTSETPAAGISTLLDMDTYTELLALLPDEYFDEPAEIQARYWRQVYHVAAAAIAEGEQDVERLAQLYLPSYNQTNQESVK